jgi:hypothetical protein
MKNVILKSILASALFAAGAAQALANTLPVKTESIYIVSGSVPDGRQILNMPVRSLANVRLLPLFGMSASADNALAALSLTKTYKCTATASKYYSGEQSALKIYDLRGCQEVSIGEVDRAVRDADEIQYPPSRGWN